MTDEERFRNAVIYGTSHVEMYMTTDDAIIEAMARAMFKDNQINRLDIAKAALAVARPIIEAPLRAENEKLLRRIHLFKNTRNEKVFEKLIEARAENEKLRASNAVFLHHLGALHEEMLGRIDSKIEDGQNHTDEALFLAGLLQSNLEILELCWGKSAATALKGTEND